MSLSTQEGPSIQIGYPYRNRVVVKAPDGGPGPALFPSGATFRAQVRSRRDISSLFVELTTENGRIVRVSDTEIEIYIPAAETLDMPAGQSIILDFARTDLIEPEHLRIALKIPVVMSVTRPTSS